MTKIHHTTYERLYKAVDSLSTGTSSLQKRLEYAAISLVPLIAREFPDDLQSEFDSIMEALSNKPEKVEGEGTIAATTRQMPDEKAQEIAESILSLFASVADL